MSYVALRSLKVQLPDGKMDRRAPGDAVPEAEHWKGRERWVRRGWIAPATSDAVKSLRDSLSKSKPVDPSGKPIKDLAAHKDKKGKVAMTVPPAPAPEPPPPAPEPAPAVEESPKASTPTKESLAALTKVQLITIGEGYGLTLSESTKKEDLVEAVLAAASGV